MPLSFEGWLFFEFSDDQLWFLSQCSYIVNKVAGWLFIHKEPVDMCAIYNVGYLRENIDLFPTGFNSNYFF